MPEIRVKFALTSPLCRNPMSHLLMKKVLSSLPAEGWRRLNGPEWAGDKDQFTKMAAYFSSTACILGWLKWKQLSGTWRFPVSLSSWFKMGRRGGQGSVYKNGC